MNLKLDFGSALNTGIMIGGIKLTQIKDNAVAGVRFIFRKMITQKNLDELEDLKFMCVPSGDLFIGATRRWLKPYPTVVIVITGKPYRSRGETEAIIPTPFAIGA